MSRAEVVERLTGDVLVAVLRGTDARSVVDTTEALVAGGIRSIEITYTTPGATEAIAELAARFGDEITLGAGTIVRAEQARDAVQAGARFLVSPGTRPDLAAELRGTGSALLLGALTPGEVMAALEEGADLVKLFPANLGGPGYLRSLRGPFPGVAFCPTGGVNPETIHDWLAAGAVALGAGSELCPPQRIAAGDWAGITETARRFVAAVGLVSRASR